MIAQIRALTASVALCAATALTGADSVEIWTFDRIDRIGGHVTTMLGHPTVIDSPLGKAVEFNGTDDALFLDVHPLTGAQTFTLEILFRPDRDGKLEQRFFHLQERDPNTGIDTMTRMLMEIRVIGEQWALDSFALSGTSSQAPCRRSGRRQSTDGTS